MPFISILHITQILQELHRNLHGGMGMDMDMDMDVFIGTVIYGHLTGVFLIHTSTKYARMTG